MYTSPEIYKWQQLETWMACKGSWVKYRIETLENELDMWSWNAGGDFILSNDKAFAGMLRLVIHIILSNVHSYSQQLADQTV